MREPRGYNDKIKYSHRFYVGNVRISNYNIKNLMIENGLNNNEIYDLSDYDKQMMKAVAPFSQARSSALSVFIPCPASPSERGGYETRLGCISVVCPFPPTPTPAVVA